ncbi:MAG: glycosyltransferase family 4 protein [Candidatus Dormibacteraeota bacterium]|nr:glycosyltransferase family 4 protein [Candidatus Dormibacteraeota bacterium]
MRRLRVAWLGHESAKMGGGMATYSNEVVDGLRQMGHHVTFFHHGDRSGRDTDENSESVSLASVALMKPLVLSPGRAKRKLVDRLRQRDFDVVHASFWFSSMDFDLPKLARERGIPLVATFHVAFDNRFSLWGGITSGTYRLYAPTLAKCDRVIVFGPAQRDILLNLGVPEAVMRILPNGVDVDRYSPGPSDKKQKYGADRLFMYMGRVDSEKNVDVLLEAFLDSSPPREVKLLIMGTGTEKRRLERFYKDPRVIFTGHIAEADERIAILRAADAFFLPSTVEGLSLSMLEAMACGVATIATDVGTDGEALRGAGIVIDPRSLATELEMAVRQMIELPFLSVELGRMARERVLERYSLARNLQSLAALYEDLVGPAAGRSA